MFAYIQMHSVDLVLKISLSCLKKLGELGEGVVQVTDMFFFILKGD